MNQKCNTPVTAGVEKVSQMDSTRSTTVSNDSNSNNNINNDIPTLSKIVDATTTTTTTTSTTTTTTAITTTTTTTSNSSTTSLVKEEESENPKKQNVTKENTSNNEELPSKTKITIDKKSTHRNQQDEKAAQEKKENKVKKDSHGKDTNINDDDDHGQYPSQESQKSQKSQEPQETQEPQKPQKPQNELDEKIAIIKKWLKDCDAILIGAGAGLSVAAGLSDADLNFEVVFKDFIEEYGMTSIYAGAFTPFPSPEEKWAYYARNSVVYIDAPSKPLYHKILKLVQPHDYFILTTNVDGQFEKSGFLQNQVFATQGDFTHLQCSVPCHDQLYESVDHLKEMVRQTRRRKIPTSLLPTCPKCGQPMVSHLRMDQSFVMNEDWYRQNEAYHQFVQRYQDKKLLLLEFGVGFNTPSIIRFPFERQTMNHEKWTLVRLNKDYPGLILQNAREDTVNDWKYLQSLPLKNEFQHRFIPIADDINEVIDRLLEE